MTESQLRRLHQSGLIAIEPHSESHPKFTDLSDNEIEREVRESKSYIETILNKHCRHFAYPKGCHSVAAHRVLARCGVRFAYTIERGRVKPSNDPYTLKRNGIGANVTFTQFKGIATLGHLAGPSFTVRWKSPNQVRAHCKIIRNKMKPDMSDG